MSLNRSNTRRRSQVSQNEEVENPNAYGFWGRYEDAPQAIAANEEAVQEQFQTQSHRHSQGWSTVGVYRNNDPNLVEHHHPHLPFHHQHNQTTTGDHRQNLQVTNPALLYRNQSNETISDMDSRQAHDISAQYVGRTPDNEDPNTPLVTSGMRPGMTEHQGRSNQSPAHGSPTHSEEQKQVDPNLVGAFDAVHGSSGGHIAQHGHQIPIRLGHLFKRPLIRQWVLEDKVYREIDDREPSQYELFFDLVMVGIIHKLADGAAESATGLSVAKFVLCFYPAWSVWSDLRSYMNVSGTDDVWQRIYTLLIMITLVGYAANATGIHIEKEIGDSGEGSGGFERRSMFFRRAEEGSGEGVPLKLVQRIGDTDFWFAEGWHTAIASAIGFYLVAKVCRLGLYFIYGILLPKFRKALWLNAIALVVVSCIYLPIIFLDQPGTIVVLICIGVISELAIRYGVAGILQMLHGHSKHRGHKTYIPAYSLPHMMERTTLFTILVIGETIMNATFVAGPEEYGPRSQFWRAALSMTIAFMLMWIYFDVDSSRTFVHGLKRHWFTSITYTNLHFPLCASLILMSSTLVTMISEARVDRSYMWFFAGSIGTAMLCMGILGMLHKSLDRWNSALIPKSARIGLRFMLAIVFYLMPIIHDWTSSEYLGIHAALLAFAVAFETFGKLGAVGRVYDQVRAERLRQERLSSRSLSSGEIPLDHLENAEPKPAHAKKPSAANAFMHKIHKDGRIKGPDKRASWHEYDDLTGEETGENDVGVESELGRLEAKQVASGERWAYVAS